MQYCNYIFLTMDPDPINILFCNTNQRFSFKSIRVEITLSPLKKKLQKNGENLLYLLFAKVCYLPNKKTHNSLKLIERR